MIYIHIVVLLVITSSQCHDLYTHCITFSHQCYMSSFVEIGPQVPKKIFEGFLPFMDMVDILVM